MSDQDQTSILSGVTDNQSYVDVGPEDLVIGNNQLNQPHTNDILVTSTIDDAGDLLSTREDEQEPGFDHESAFPVLDQLNADVYNDPYLYPTATNSSIIRFNDSNIKLPGGSKRQLVCATATALIVELTSPKSIDYQFLLDFFLTYRMFLKTETLLEMLMARFMWAFKLTFSDKQTSEADPSKMENGKLVLIRTFVTIRHWLLNYFQDDFINNTSLKLMFVSFINELCQYSVQVSQLASEDQKPNIEIGTRILLEMKKVYINLCSIYWSTIPLEHIKPAELLSYPLNLYEHMNSTRLSTMGLQQTYDPSFRNSGILSLYNSNSNSATNLLLQKHNENKAKLMANFLHHNNRSKNRPFKIFSDNDKHFLHPKDSLMSLKKSYVAAKGNPKTPLKPTLTNIIRDEVKYTPLEGVKRLSKNELEDLLQLSDQGFVTNGNIGVFTDSKIHKITPATPDSHKKKQSAIKMPLEQQQQEHQLALPLSRPLDRVPHPQKVVSFQVPPRKTENSKTGLTKLVHSWKKHFQKQKIEHKELTPLIDNVSNIINPTSVPKRNKLHKVSSESTLTDIPQEEDPELQNLDIRVDVLSARIIQEFQYLLNDQTFKVNLSKQLLNEPRRRKSVFSLLTILKDNDYNDDNDIENTFSISPTKKFTPMMDDATSFKAPSVSFNWTDSFNNTTDSHKAAPVDNIVPSMIDDLKIQEPGVFDPLETTPLNDSDISKFPVLQVINNHNHQMDEFDSKTPVDEINPRMSVYSTKSYISYDSMLSREESNEINKQSPLQSPLNDDNGSVKSYLSYDSALSLDFPRDGAEELPGTPNYKLKKKLSFQDLKNGSPKKDVLPKSESSYMNVSLAKEEYENLINLKLLPFRVTNISSSMTNIIKRDSSSFFELVKEYRLSVNNDLMVLEPRVSSFGAQSVDESDGVSLADFESTLSRIEDNPYGDDDGVYHDNGAPSEKFGTDFESGSRISMIPSIHSSVIMPFPGLDSAAIAELAAIPDDTYSIDPVAALLMKLEGKYIKGSGGQEEVGRVFYGLNDEMSQDEDSATQSSIDEVKLQNKVRDLFITTNPGSPNPIITSTIMSQRGLDKANNNQGNSNVDDIIASTPYREGAGTGSSTDPDFDRSLSISTSKRASNEIQPTLESILDSNTHISFILSYDSRRLAEQLTLIEKDALLEIDWKELIELRWQQTVEPINSWLELLLDENKRKGVNLVICRFNLMINWIISEILLTSSIQERKVIISRCIHIADHCTKLQNYSTVMQIILALTSNKIAKLTKTWKLVPKDDILILKNLEKLASPFKNFANLRNQSNSIIPSKGCIPFLGLYLSDLTFNAERPNFFKKDDPNDSAMSVDKSLISDSSESFKLINFAKFRTSAGVVRSLIQRIEWSKLYNIKVEHEIVSKCLYIKSLTDEEMNVCILRIGE